MRLERGKSAVRGVSQATLNRLEFTGLPIAGLKAVASSYGLKPDRSAVRRNSDRNSFKSVSYAADLIHLRSQPRFKSSLPLELCLYSNIDLVFQSSSPPRLVGVPQLVQWSNGPPLQRQSRRLWRKDFSNHDFHRHDTNIVSESWLSRKRIPRHSRRRGIYDPPTLSYNRSIRDHGIGTPFSSTCPVPKSAFALA